MAEESKANLKEFNYLGLFKIKLRDISSHAVFLEKEGGTILNYGMRNALMDLTVRKEEKVMIDMKREIMIDKLISGVEIPKQKSFKDKALFGAPTSYQTIYWKGRNIRPLTVKEVSILDKLEKKEK
ncbi:hypothetical protein VSO92_00905 [Myroides pelagicus]|uniref:hypothetical protein n=1 Tax=Myroides pelagicus TaxID=270914 RepID=UPI002DB619B8|nr:hypothetical protein [Myroides pelagicus]MEC4112676.1 hypothetical protein [Myroides pelagicus]